MGDEQPEHQDGSEQAEETSSTQPRRVRRRDTADVAAALKQAGLPDHLLTLAAQANGFLTAQAALRRAGEESGHVRGSGVLTATR